MNAILRIARAPVASSVLLIFIMLGASFGWSQSSIPPKLHYVTIEAAAFDSSINILQIHFNRSGIKAVVVSLSVNGKPLPLLFENTSAVEDTVASWHFEGKDNILRVLAPNRGINGSITLVVAASIDPELNAMDCVGLRTGSSMQNQLTGIKISRRE